MIKTGYTYKITVEDEDFCATVDIHGLTRNVVALTVTVLEQLVSGIAYKHCTIAEAFVVDRGI